MVMACIVGGVGCLMLVVDDVFCRVLSVYY